MSGIIKDWVDESNRLLYLQPFLDFMHSWEKYKIAYVLFFSLTLIFGWGDSATIQAIYAVVALLIASSVLMLFKPKEERPFPWSLPFDIVAIVWLFSVLGALGLELVLFIRAIAGLTGLSTDIVIFSIIIIVPLFIVLYNRIRKRPN